MNANLANALRHGGMSRRGFLRALGVTAASTLVPGLGLYPVYRSGTRYVGPPCFTLGAWLSMDSAGKMSSTTPIRWMSMNEMFRLLRNGATPCP